MNCHTNIGQVLLPNRDLVIYFMLANTDRFQAKIKEHASINAYDHIDHKLDPCIIIEETYYFNHEFELLNTHYLHISSQCEIAS